MLHAHVLLSSFWTTPAAGHFLLLFLEATGSYHVWRGGPAAERIGGSKGNPGHGMLCGCKSGMNGAGVKASRVGTLMCCFNSVWLTPLSTHVNDKLCTHVMHTYKRLVAPWHACRCHRHYSRSGSVAVGAVQVLLLLPGLAVSYGLDSSW